MFLKDLKKQQAKEKKQAQEKKQALDEKAKKIIVEKKPITTQPKQIDESKKREESFIKLLKDINRNYKKFNEVDINTIDYKSAEQRKIVVMLRDLPINKQQEFIQDFLEQVEQDKEIKSSTFFKDKYTEYKEQDESEVKKWDEKNRVIREFLSNTFSKEDLDKDNFDSSSFVKKIRSYPSTQRKFFTDLNKFIPSLLLQQKYIKKFLKQDKLNAGQYLQKFTNEYMEEIKAGMQKKSITHDDVFGTDESDEEIDIEADEEDENEEGEKDIQGEDIEDGEEDILKQIKRMKTIKKMKTGGDLYNLDFYVPYKYNKDEDEERLPLIKEDDERINMFFKDLNLELEDDEILKNIEKFKQNSSNYSRIVSFIERLLDKLSILQIKKYIREFLEQSTLNYSNYLDVFISGYGMTEEEDVKTKKFLKKLVDVDYEKWDKKISKFEKKKGADYSRRQFVYTLRSYPKDVIKEYINTLGDKNAQKYLIEFITIPAVRIQRIQLAPNIVGEEKVKYIYNNRKVVIPQTRVDEDGNTEVYYTDKNGKEVDKRLVKFSALGELKDLESDIKPLIKSSYIDTTDPRTYVDMFCVIDYQRAPWIGKTVKNMWVNTKNAKYLITDQFIKFGGKNWYKPSIKFYALLCSRANREQEKKTLKVKLGDEEVDFKIMYEIEGEDQEDKKYLIQDKKMFKKMRRYFINKNSSKNKIIENLLEEKLSDKNVCLRSEGLKFIKDKTNLPESFCIEIEKEIFDKNILTESSVREYFEIIVDNVSFFDSVIIKQDNRVFYNHVVDGYFTASGLINLPYEMRMPTIFKNSLISGEEKIKTLKYIEMIKSDYIKILSNNVYKCLHPYENTQTIPENYIFPDIELKKLDNNEKRNICKNKDIFNDKSKTDFEIYFDIEDGSYYCLPIKELLQEFEADNFINPETGREFNKIFIDKIMKLKKPVVTLEKEVEKKKLVAPGLLELLLTNINKFKIQLNPDLKSNSELISDQYSESESESNSESEKESISDSKSKSKSKSISESISESKSKSISESEKESDLESFKSMSDKDSVSPKSSFSNSQQKSVTCKQCQKSISEEDSHKTMIPPDHMFHFCSINCFEENDHGKWPKAKKSKKNKTNKTNKTKKSRK